MCSPGVAAGANAGLQILGNYMGQKSAAAASQEQMEANRTAAIKGMNYKFQNYEQERINAFDTAVNELDKIAHQGMELGSNVDVALNENMSNGGRTADMIRRQVSGDTARTRASLQDNYDLKQNEIDLNKESALISTKDYIDNLNNSAPKMPSAFENLLSSSQIILGSYTKYQDERQHRINTEGGTTFSHTNNSSSSSNYFQMGEDGLNYDFYNPLNYKMKGGIKYGKLR
jgi:hypothetical protein